MEGQSIQFSLMHDQRRCMREKMLIEVIRDIFYVLNRHFKVSNISE